MSVTEAQITSLASGSRAMKLIDALNIIKTAPQSAARRFDVFFVCAFTPLHLKTFLEAHLQLLCPDRRVRVQTGLYGDLAGNLERASVSRPDAVAIALEWPDLDPRLGIRSAPAAVAAHHDIRESVHNHLRLIEENIDEQFADVTIAVSLPSVEPRALGTQPGWLANELDAALLQSVADFTVWAAARKNIRVVNPRRLDAWSPSTARWDVRSELSTGFPYQLNHASILADLLSRLIRPPLPRKGLITDLDDTLWSGIVGEVGADGISWNLETQSHVHALYQQQLHAMTQAGVLVAVASKNDPAIVQQAFARPDLLVNVNQVFPLEVSWGPKSEAVRRILNTWNVGADSVVFVDDSPMEMAEVQSVFPDIQCLLFPKHDPRACIDLLDRIRDLFGKQTISKEDTLRAHSIRVRPSSTKDFLEDSEAEITFSTITDASDSRPLELINKTNQFNLNGRRYTDADWLNHVRDPKSRLFAASYKDKYGHLGKIAVLSGRVERDGVLVEVWVMSCRAFSRRIEHQCMRQLFSRFAVDKVCFDFEQTARNAPIAEFFAGLLGTKPEGRFTLSQKDFAQKCPKLFHTVMDEHE